MILTRLTDADWYAELSEEIAAAIRFLREHDVTALENGRYPVDGERVYVNVMSYETAPKPVMYEAHRRYIDIQYIAAGEERVWVTPTDRLTVTQSYDADRDCLLGTGDGFDVPLWEGWLLVLYPEDAHAPSCLLDKPSQVKKAVVKVAV